MFYSPRSKTNLRRGKTRQNTSKKTKIGTLLREADLVSSSQVELALQAKEQYSHLRLGEIIAMQGWLKSETADFFVEEWSRLLRQRYREPLGYYLQQAALLEQQDVDMILEEQIQTGVRFGTVAVLQGLIKSTTLDFFLMNLFPEELDHSPFVNMRSSRRVKSSSHRSKSTISSCIQEQANFSWQDSAIDEVENTGIIWVD